MFVKTKQKLIFFLNEKWTFAETAFSLRNTLSIYTFVCILFSTVVSISLSGCLYPEPLYLSFSLFHSLTLCLPIYLSALMSVYLYIFSLRRSLRFPLFFI